MPAPCSCRTSCTCTIRGDGVSTAVSGLGTLDSPYVVQAFEDTDFPGSPARPLLSAALLRPDLGNAWWRTPTMPTQFLHGRDVQLTASGFLHPPAGLTATSIALGAATVTWSAVPGATAYRVTRTEYAGDAGMPEFQGTVVQTLDVATPSVGFTGLNPANGYGIRVAARDATGTSLPSGELRFTVNGGRTVGPPAVPSGLTVNPDLRSAVLSWVTVARALRYRLEVRPAADPAGWLVSDVELPPHTVLQLALDTAYAARVAAVNADGISAYTAELAFRTDPAPVGQPPGPPTGLTAGLSGANVDALWLPPARADSYLLLFSAPGDPGGTIASTQPGATIPGSRLRPGLTYSLRVVALNGFGSSPESLPASVAIPALGSPPVAAQVLSGFFDPAAGAVKTSFFVQSADAVTHYVERRSDNVAAGRWQLWHFSSASPSFIDFTDAHGLTGGTFVIYRHYSENAFGRSPYSLEVTVEVPLNITPPVVTPPPPPPPPPVQFPAPTGLGVVPYIGGGLRFLWDVMPGATGYVGSVSGGGRTETINNGTAENNTTIFNNPTAGVEYVLSVAAVYPGGQSSTSTWSTVGGPGTPPPPPPPPSGGTMPQPQVTWNPVTARAAIASANSLQDVVNAWAAHVRPTFGVGLRLHDGVSSAPGSTSNPVAAPGPEDLPVVRGMMMAACRALAFLPPAFVRHTETFLGFKNYVICGTLPGLLGIYIGQEVWLPVDQYTGQTTGQADSHRNYLLLMHETAHAMTIGAPKLGRTDLAQWSDYDSNFNDRPLDAWVTLNRASYSPTANFDAGAWNGGPSFVSQYATASFNEDLAETFTVLFDTAFSGLPARMQADPGVRGKVRLMVSWLSARGLKAFDSLLSL